MTSPRRQRGDRANQHLREVNAARSTGHIDIGENRVDIEHVCQEEADEHLIFYDALQLIHLGSPWLFREVTRYGGSLPGDNGVVVPSFSSNVADAPESARALVAPIASVAVCYLFA